MAKIMLDASAVLAYLNSEPGADVVAARVPDGIISTVNLAEVVTYAIRTGETLESTRAKIGGLGLATVDYTVELAVQTGALIAATKQFGLSLGDRACLATAAREGVPVLTAERSWSNLSLGIAIQLIR